MLQPWNHGIIKAGKVLQDHQIQPSTKRLRAHETISQSATFGGAAEACSVLSLEQHENKSGKKNLHFCHVFL